MYAHIIYDLPAPEEEITDDLLLPFMPATLPLLRAVIALLALVTLPAFPQSSFRQFRKHHRSQLCFDSAYPFTTGAIDCTDFRCNFIVNKIISYNYS